jgi:hypothetical protein
MVPLVPGDRVEIASVGCKGVVEFGNEEYVRVKWDDGKVGLLYFDDRQISKARHLLRLAKEDRR